MDFKNIKIYYPKISIWNNGLYFNYFCEYKNTRVTDISCLSTVPYRFDKILSAKSNCVFLTITCCINVPSS